jgi:hypothetical protein
MSGFLETAIFLYIFSMILKIFLLESHQARRTQIGIIIIMNRNIYVKAKLLK